MKYGVFENNKPCKYPEHKVDPSWNNYLFDTFREAQEYAIHWMGNWAPLDKDVLELNTPYDISGYGDMLEIRVVQL